jgi:hypothetical protein
LALKPQEHACELSPKSWLDVVVYCKWIRVGHGTFYAWGLRQFVSHHSQIQALDITTINTSILLYAYAWGNMCRLGDMVQATKQCSNETKKRKLQGFSGHNIPFGFLTLSNQILLMSIKTC